MNDDTHGMTKGTKFPAGFVWGTATASYQIEGAVAEAGRKPSVWDTFSHTSGRILNGDNGDEACDHFHRYRDDIATMGELGVNGYRFSLAWPRLQPEGTGPLNSEGVGFYDRLVDGMLAAGIQPFATLYHWDLPQQLEDLGGWPNRDTAYRFADYSAAVHARFSDRISSWITLNEPWCSAFLGYASGHHAPGITDPAASVRSAHHLLLGHGLAIDAMRSTYPEGEYGISVNLYPVRAATDDPADVDAARRVDGVCNRLFLDPVLRGRYPADVVADLEPIAGNDFRLDGDAQILGAPVDFVGINYYSSHVVRAPKASDPDVFEDGSTREPAWVGATDVVKLATGRARTAMGWEIDPDGLAETLRRVWNDYGQPPLYITESGIACDDELGPDGAVHDEARIDYLEAHFRAAHRTIADGVDLRGYFVWTLMDNFEWAWGYDRRFGLVYVDFETQQRTIKDSGRWFSTVTATNQLSDHER